MHVLLSSWYLSKLFCIVVQSCILVVVIFICLIKSKWNLCIVTTIVFMLGHGFKISIVSCRQDVLQVLVYFHSRLDTEEV